MGDTWRFVLILFLFFTTTLLGILSSRYRDIQPLLAAVMPMLFFLSPVLFRIPASRKISWLIWLNPFTYFIVLVREPLQETHLNCLSLLWLSS